MSTRALIVRVVFSFNFSEIPVTMLKRASLILKRYQPLFHILRSICYSALARYDAWAIRLHIARLELLRLWFPSMQDAFAKEWKYRRIGSEASGRDIVMLVVADLRVDPRVEREARALAGARYNVTVICPEPYRGSGKSFDIDWGPGVSIKYIHFTASRFVGG
jgi:hypothetical protein